MRDRRCRTCGQLQDPDPLPRYRRRWREMLIEGLGGLSAALSGKLTHVVGVRGEPDTMAMTEEEAREAVRSLRDCGVRWVDVSVTLILDLKEFMRV